LQASPDRLAMGDWGYLFYPCDHSQRPFTGTARDNNHGSLGVGIKTLGVAYELVWDSLLAGDADLVIPADIESDTNT